MTRHCKGCGLQLRGMSPQARTHGAACWEWWKHNLNRIDAPPFHGLEYGGLLTKPADIHDAISHIEDGCAPAPPNVPGWFVDDQKLKSTLSTLPAQRQVELKLALDWLLRLEAARVRLRDGGLDGDRLDRAALLLIELATNGTKAHDRSFSVIGARLRMVESGLPEHSFWVEYKAALNDLVTATWGLRRRNRGQLLPAGIEAKADQEAMERRATMFLMTKDHNGSSLGKNPGGSITEKPRYDKDQDRGTVMRRVFAVAA